MKERPWYLLIYLMERAAEKLSIGLQSATGIPARACFGFIWIQKLMIPEFGWKTKVASAR